MRKEELKNKIDESFSLFYKILDKYKKIYDFNIFFDRIQIYNPQKYDRSLDKFIRTSNERHHITLGDFLISAKTYTNNKKIDTVNDMLWSIEDELNDKMGNDPNWDCAAYPCSLWEHDPSIYIRFFGLTTEDIDNYPNFIIEQVGDVLFIDDLQEVSVQTIRDLRDPKIRSIAKEVRNSKAAEMHNRVMDTHERDLSYGSKNPRFYPYNEGRSR